MLTGGGAGVGLRSLYGWSTRLVPRQSNAHGEAFLQLWLGFARHQWCACHLKRLSQSCTAPDAVALAAVLLMLSFYHISSAHLLEDSVTISASVTTMLRLVCA